MAATTTAARPRIEVGELKAAASGRWREILISVAGLPAQALDGRHHACPRCGGTDRFRFSDQDSSGSTICNQCGNCGDGLAAVQKYAGCDFPAAVQRVADFLGLQPAKKAPSKNSLNPEKYLEFLPWDQSAVARWCLRKKPIKPEAIQAIGGRLAKYRRDYLVIALPIRGSQGEPVGWVLFNASGGKLPCWTNGTKQPTWEKMKTTAGSKAGYLGRIVDGPAAVKCEGPPDMLALLSCDDLPADVSVITNANGAKEDPIRLAWLCKSLGSGRRVLVVPDADKPGIEGATEVTSGGRSRPGWAPAISRHAESVRVVRLPYEISETAGKDLRDWLQEGGTYQTLQSLPADEIDQQKIRPIEADDDPHRLARVNLDRYGRHADGATLRYWRDQWYTWKPSRGCYRQIGDNEFRAKINAAIKEEFDRLNICHQEESKKEPEKTRKVNAALVSNVIAATASLPGVLIPSSVEQMTWLTPSGERLANHRYVAMHNGILDIEKATDMVKRAEVGEEIRDEDFRQCLQPHSPQWFSEVVLPYDFDPSAECPRWDEFLRKNLEADGERIDLLQEWAGYLLLPDTGQQKFLVLEGEGSNGKSVYCAAIEAMLGRANCSHITLEVFGGDRFSKTQTLGKLANIAGDTGEIDKVAEGYLKSFTSGDVMFFDRKGISGVDCIPTARMMLACNNRPRFADRSQGIWRRMILCPFRVEVQQHEQVPNMDKHWWWEATGEMPGIFNWALIGLARLQRQGRFTRSKIVEEATADYKNEMNPARQFLMENVEFSESGMIRSTFLYEFYCRWIKESGYRSLGERQFFKEVKRIFPMCDRKKMGPREKRFYVYEKINFSQDEICGQETDDIYLF